MSGRGPDEVRIRAERGGGSAALERAPPRGGDRPQAENACGAAVTHAIQVHVRPIQTCLALLFLTATIVAGGPLGCDLLLKPPEIPEMKAPEAPDVQAPEGPEGPKV